MRRYTPTGLVPLDEKQAVDHAHDTEQERRKQQNIDSIFERSVDLVISDLQDCRSNARQESGDGSSCLEMFIRHDANIFSDLGKACGRVSEC